MRPSSTTNGSAFGTAYNLHAGIPIPLFDRNRGNIMSADAL